LRLARRASRAMCATWTGNRGGNNRATMVVYGARRGRDVCAADVPPSDPMPVDRRARCLPQRPAPTGGRLSCRGLWGPSQAQGAPRGCPVPAASDPIGADKDRLDKAGVPLDPRGYRSRYPLALDMLQTSGTRLPHGWIAGDDEMGRPYWWRRRLDRLGERSMLVVPGHTLMRDLETAPPEYNGRGHRPQRPWPRIDQWSIALSRDAWAPIDVAMVPTAPWSSRWSKLQWWHARRSVRKASRRWP
jgi:hypothetical protein